MATVVDTVSAQIEKVRNKLEAYFESSDQIAGLIKKAGDDKVQVSRYLYRVPVQLFRGGHFHKVNLDGGAVKAGTGMKVTHLTAGYFNSARSYRITDEQVDTSGNTTQSAVNVFQKTLSEAMLEAQIDDDICLHTDGTGKLTNASAAQSGTSNTEIAFSAAGDTLGVGRLREGMVVDVWKYDGSALRTGGTGKTITNINYATKTITLSSAYTSVDGEGDLLAISNVAAYGPSTPTSFSSTWPGDALTNGPGLTGDSFRHGIYYANDATASNYYLGRQKSALSQLLPTAINAASSALVFPHGNLLLDGIVQRRDADVVKGLVGIAHMAQRSQVFNIGIAISNWNRGGSDKMIDVMPKGLGYSETFEFCGIPCYLSKRQDRARFDFINPKLWGRAQTKDTHFKEVGGKTVFEVRDGNGDLNFAVEFHILQHYDFVCYDPGAQGYIYGLSLPTGY